MQPDRIHLAGQWRATAAEDLRVAEILASESPSIAAFHAHQAAEKALKAACIISIDDAPARGALEAARAICVFADRVVAAGPPK